MKDLDIEDTFYPWAADIRRRAGLLYEAAFHGGFPDLDKSPDSEERLKKVISKVAQWARRVDQLYGDEADGMEAGKNLGDHDFECGLIGFFSFSNFGNYLASPKDIMGKVPSFCRESTWAYPSNLQGLEFRNDDAKRREFGSLLRKEARNHPRAIHSVSKCLKEAGDAQE